MHWIASSAFGIEGITAKELRNMGMKDVMPLDTAGVRFTADPLQALEANIRLRSSDRVLLEIVSGPVFSFDDLFRLTASFRWETLIGRNDVFPVRAHCARSKIMSPSDCQSIVKKAVSKRLSAVYGLDWLPETENRYQIDVAVRNDLAVITLDSSGDALNKRGYRTWKTEAPIRETMAAALLEMSPWHPGLPFYDPMCGSGTLPIEAGLMVTNTAPGIYRHFDIEQWSVLNKTAAEDLRRKILSEIERERLAASPVAGSDISDEAVGIAKKNASQAHLNICLQAADADDLVLDEQKGVMIVNPPYGERIGDEASALRAASLLGKIWRENPGWTVCAISSVPGFEKAFGRKCDKRRRLYNGRIECEFMTFTCQNLSTKKGGRNK